MKVTVNLEEELYEAAIKKAADVSKPFSEWLASLISKELESDAVDGSMTLGEALGDESLADIEWDTESRREPARDVSFE